MMEAATPKVKTCPECAESVQAAALVCRYCRHRFDGGASAAAASKSPGGAAILSLVIPGLGHLYLGEHWRGGVLIATFVLALVGAFATDTLGPGGLVAIIGAVDAYRGGKDANAGSPLRDVGRGLWILLAVVLALVAYALISADEADREYNECLLRQELSESPVICTPP